MLFCCIDLGERCARVSVARSRSRLTRSTASPAPNAVDVVGLMPLGGSGKSKQNPSCTGDHEVTSQCHVFCMTQARDGITPAGLAMMNAPRLARAWVRNTIAARRAMIAASTSNG